MLILFDIDGTLLLTRGQGMLAMQDAGRELVGPHFSIDGADYSGRLDPLIWRQLCEINGVADADGLHDAFRAAYLANLKQRFDDGAAVEILPGVAELIGGLQAEDEITLGLVTGNYPETGQLKIETGGLDFEVFTVFGWGSDGDHRRDLPRVAIERYEATNGGRIDRERVVIIGDTPHDVDCARHNGCRSLAVATGRFALDDLREHRPDHAVESLADTAAVLDWLGRDGRLLAQ